MKKTGPDEGGDWGEIPPVSGRESENCFKNAWKCVKFQKIFACGAYRHRRRHQSFSIIKDKFFKFYGDEHKFCHFSRLRHKIFATKIFYQNFSIPILTSRATSGTGSGRKHSGKNFPAFQHDFMTSPPPRPNFFPTHGQLAATPLTSRARFDYEQAVQQSIIGISEVSKPIQPGFGTF